RGKSQEYIDRIMVTPNPGTVLLFIASIVIGALVGALIGQALSKKFAQKI
ncbi:TPA: MptD family putative ECF transporter S component, partial [Streptococcus pneumoniae]